jgi:hypothetical protein
MVVLLGVVLMEALPEVTTPPTGSALTDVEPKASRRLWVRPFNKKHLAASESLGRQRTIGMWLSLELWRGRMDLFAFCSLKVLESLKPKATRSIRA